MFCGIKVQITALGYGGLQSILAEMRGRRVLGGEGDAFSLNRLSRRGRILGCCHRAYRDHDANDYGWLEYAIHCNLPLIRLFG